MPKLTPLRYDGNKAGQVKRLRLALPEQFDYLIEPFCGSAAFSLSMIDDGIIDAENVWLNDKNPSLMAFNRVLRDNRYELMSGLRHIQNERGIGDKNLFLEALGNLENPTGDLIDLAMARFIENMLGIKGKVSKKGNFCEPILSGYGLRKKHIDNLEHFGRLLQGTKQSCLDFRDIVPPSKDTLIYLDGPYGDIRKDADSYGADYTLERAEFAEACNEHRDNGHLLISYGDNQESIELFSGWNIYRVPVVRPSCTTKTKTELIITNYEIPNADLLPDEWEKIGTLTPPLSKQKYQVIYSDPPWKFENDKGKRSCAANHYDTCAIDELKRIPVADIVADEAVMYMWATEYTQWHVEELMNAWGFTLNKKNRFVWVKTNKNGEPIGARGVRCQIAKPVIEYLMVGTTRNDGKMPWADADGQRDKRRQLVYASVERIHSKKPVDFRRLIESINGDNKSWG